jgi:hypothetical protein
MDYTVQLCKLFCNLSLFFDSAGGVLLRNLELKVMELVDCGLSLGATNSLPSCPHHKEPSTKGVCHGDCCMSVN